MPGKQRAKWESGHVRGPHCGAAPDNYAPTCASGVWFPCPFVDMCVSGACSPASSECCSLTIIDLQAATSDSAPLPCPPTGSAWPPWPLLTLLCHARVTQHSGTPLGPGLCQCVWGGFGGVPAPHLVILHPLLSTNFVPSQWRKRPSLLTSHSRAGRRSTCVSWAPPDGLGR